MKPNMKQKTSIGCINKQNINIVYDEASARYIGEVLEREEYKFLLGHLKKKDNLVIVDIGANIGTFSLYVYDIAEKIYAIEPLKNVLNMLNETIEENNLKKIKTHCLAIGNFTGKGAFNKVEPFSAGASFLDVKGSGEVDVMTLNDFCAKEGITHIDILKIDTEGGEVDILRATDFEKLPIDIIIGEIHPGRINENEFFSLLKGFKTLRSGGNHFIATKL